MLKLILGLAAIYAISWIVSTPESRAEAKPWADYVGKRLFAIAMGLLALLWLLGRQTGPPG